jgi:peroxiredoxin
VNRAATGASFDDLMGALKFITPAAQLAFIVVAAAATFGFVRTAQDGELRRRCGAFCLSHPTYAAANKVAPDFELAGHKGERLSMASLRGKTVLLNFWSMTCAPCMEEMPDLAELAKTLADRRDIAIVTVSTDEDQAESLAALKAVIGGEPPFPVLFDPEREVVTKLFGTKKYPETWLIDDRGVIRARFDSPRDWTGGFMSELLDQTAGGTYCPAVFSAGRELSGNLCGMPSP